jgi:putative tricarboxylic transport membrane protein
MRRDLVCSIALLGVAASYYWLATDINRSALADEIGAHGLPYAYAALLALAAVALALSSLLRAARERAAPESVDEDRSLIVIGRAAGACAIGVLYLVILPFVGYLIATASLLAVMLRYLGEPLGLRVATIAVAGAIMLWLVFEHVLGIALPRPMGL